MDLDTPVTDAPPYYDQGIKECQMERIIQLLVEIRGMLQEKGLGHGKEQG